MMLPEFDQEMANTRKVLERIPDDKLDWKAHPKSNSIGWVASHLVNIASWVEGTMTQTEWDVHPPGEEPFRTPPLKSRAEILATFDANVATARKALQSVSDAEIMKDWSLKQGGQTLFTMPRAVVMRTFVLSHTIHHRAHLCVYLRLNDLPVPGMYGPSGDEE
jgi:uncharacterized damage-inducible protein DinB